MVTLIVTFCLVENSEMIYRIAIAILQLNIELCSGPQEPWNVFDYIIVATTTSQQIAKWFATEQETMRAMEVPRSVLQRRKLMIQEHTQ